MDGVLNGNHFGPGLAAGDELLQKQGYLLRSERFSVSPNKSDTAKYIMVAMHKVVQEIVVLPGANVVRHQHQRGWGNIVILANFGCEALRAFVEASVPGLRWFRGNGPPLHRIYDQIALGGLRTNSGKVERLSQMDAGNAS